MTSLASVTVAGEAVSATEADCWDTPFFMMWNVQVLLPVADRVMRTSASMSPSAVLTTVPVISARSPLDASPRQNPFTLTGVSVAVKTVSSAFPDSVSRAVLTSE